MDPFRPPSPGADKNAPTSDPRMTPTPDYGTLGPGSDISGPDPVQRFDRRPGPQPAILLFAILLGMLGAFASFAVARGNPILSQLTNLFSPPVAKPTSGKDSRQIDRLMPQKQAETLLEMAVAKSDGAVDQISSRASEWQGQVDWNPQIANLTTAALNSDDMRVRESGVELELAAYGLGKNSGSFDYVMKSVDSSDHAQKIWALWALGLLANRGVETEHGVGVLVEHLSDPDVDTRRWAVESLALAGSDLSIEPLLKTMHDDASPVVRERAACGIAESGLFTPQQRFTAIPQLLAYTDDPALDTQTHAWAFQALGDITHQRLPNDAAAWRAWYAEHGG